MKIGIVAGEASGDLLGAAIITELKKIFPDAQFMGVAGNKMQEAGAETLFPLEKLSVMGFTEVITRLSELLSLRNNVKNYFLEYKPDVYIGIDAPDFNLPIETVLKKNNIKTIHVNSPTIWAWRKGRIHKIKKAVDLMLTLFPFENKYYDADNIPAKYIGHPLADMIPLESEIKNNNIIALLPGSRGGEIKYIGPELLKAAVLIHQKYPEKVFVSPMINEKRLQQFSEQKKILAPHLPLKMVLGNSREVMAESELVILASGTATLEAMLLKKPMIVVYKGSRLSYQIVKYLIKINQVSLPNILCGENIVPELLQYDLTPENILKCVEDYFSHPEKIDYLQKRFLDFHQLLECNAAKKAAQAIAAALKIND